jgi:hypothetical protein
LIAQGLQTDSIVFTKIQAANYWGYPVGGIIIGAAATPATILNYCEIAYSTTGIYANVSASIQNCSIHDNRQYGIDFTSLGIDQNVTNNAFSNNLLGDIHQ